MSLAFFSAVACSGEAEVVIGADGVPVDAAGCPDPGLDDQPVSVTQYVAAKNDFGCMAVEAQSDLPPQKRWYTVRNFKIKNELGQAQAALDVACGRKPAPYPQGTFVQLIPFEAMVKRGGGFNPEANGWEFFFLTSEQDSQGTISTVIDTRGATETTNAFGGNCFSCHKQAREGADFICESTNGCDPIPVQSDTVSDLRRGDPRCAGLQIEKPGTGFHD